MHLNIRMAGAVELATGLAIFAQIVTAQKPGPGFGNNPGSAIGRTTPGVPGPTSPTIGNSNGNIYLTGKVVLDDGTPPPEPLTIERVCNGAPRAQAYTDQKGRFSFQIGQTGGVMQDASEDGSNYPTTSRQTAAGLPTVASPSAQSATASMWLENCDLRAVLAGFRSDNVPLVGRRLMDDPDVGTIVLHRLANVEGTAVSITSLQAPKDARRAYDRGSLDLRKNKLADAAKQFQKAVDIYPKYAAAWYELGRIQQQDGDTAKARQSFGNSLAADPKFISPYPPLIELTSSAENWAELADLSSQLIKLDPVDYPAAFLYHASACLHLGQIETAETSARAGEKLDSQHRYPKIEQVLAMVLARKKDYAGAVEHLRSYLLLAPDAEDAKRMKIKLAELERLSGANQEARAPAD
jgi:tetratricopeptide (TPR) repeat protein